MAKVGFSFTPGRIRVEQNGVYPVTLPADSHCLNCTDEFNEMELREERCFPCRYLGHLTKGEML